MNRWILRVFVFAVIVATGYVAKRTVFKSGAVQVRVFAVTRGDVESTVTNSRAGTIAVRRRAKLSPQLGGRVVELPHREGQRVKQGDVLLRLDESVGQAQLSLAERQVDSAQARHAETCQAAQRAERELVRNRVLAEDSMISEDKLDDFINRRDLALLGCASSQALVLEANAAVDLAQARLDLNHLRAPFDGILAELAVEVGEYVTPAPPGIMLPSLIDLIDPSSAYISAPMDEVDSAIISVGMRVRVTIDPYPDQEFEGRVARMAPFVLDFESQNRTFEIEVELADAELRGKLLPGTSADVEVILKVAQDVLQIPTSSLLEGGHVLIYEGGQLLERRVQVGLRNWNWTEITGGLKAGEQVVTNLADEDVKSGVVAELAEGQ
ncbi:MAG: HlyD family secretion protein [Planctomycetota bacterium]|jgi:HlyD family secretion protein